MFNGITKKMFKNFRSRKVVTWTRWNQQERSFKPLKPVGTFMTDCCRNHFYKSQTSSKKCDQMRQLFITMYVGCTFAKLHFWEVLRNKLFLPVFWCHFLMPAIYSETHDSCSNTADPALAGRSVLLAGPSGRWQLSYYWKNGCSIWPSLYRLELHFYNCWNS